MRTFNKDNNANRSQSNGKIEWHGVYHSLVENSFGRYMKKHTKTEDGTIRKYTNWHGGWNKEISLQSLLRHTKDLDAVYSGFNVYKYKHIVNKEVVEEETYYLRIGETVKSPWSLKETEIEFVSEEDCLNAIKFNCNAYLLNIL